MRIRSGLSLVAALALAVLAPLPSASAATTGQITGIGGKCVDVASASSANGTAVQLYDCNGTNAQQWTADGGTLRALGKCLDVTDKSTANGATLQLWDCAGSSNQQFTLNSSGDIVNAGSGKCVDATGNSSANGTRLQIWTCTGSANQKWNVTAR